MLWIIFGALAAIAILAILLPLLQRTEAIAEPTAAYDLRVYRDQLREVERDLERGIIEPADAERLRIEIGRKVLDADRALQNARQASKGPSPIWAALALILVGGLSFALYDRLGAPNLPDAPIAARLAAAEDTYRNRPTQADAEAKATPPLAVTPEPEYLELIKRLREAVAQRPDDVAGLRLLAEHEGRLGNLDAAKAAQARVLELLGKDASAEDHVRMAALLIDRAGGFISSEGEAQLVQTLRLDPKNGQARYMAGLLQIQNGRPDRAFPIWATLLAEGPRDAPWYEPIRRVIPDLAWIAGEANYTPPDAAPLPGPDQAAVDAAGDMSSADRQQMIEGMVQNLESRLAQQGGSPEEWARLIGALGVLGRNDHARDIWQEARTRFADAPEALAAVDAAAKQAGLSE